MNNRSPDPPDESPSQLADNYTRAGHDHTSAPTRCPQCEALEARIAELEAIVADRYKARSDARPSPVAPIPPLEFKALRLIPYGWGERWRLRPSPARRNWMDRLPHAYKCLPLVIANQWGWQILCPGDVVATWDGTESLDGLRIEVEPQFAPAVKSQFGAGIITFSPPWLFRTPPGWDLYLKGPSNRWKPNCVPLEGIIETWWLNYTFTLNWKMIEPGTVTFARGESLGQLVPVPHGTFENATAIEAPIGLLEPQAAEELLAWQERRRQLSYEKVKVHQLYRKAEGIEDHLQSVPVPPIRWIEPPTTDQTGKPVADDGSTREESQ